MIIVILVNDDWVVNYFIKVSYFVFVDKCGVEFSWIENFVLGVDCLGKWKLVDFLV